MATSGVIKNNFRTGYTIQAVWSAGTPNIGSNYTPVSVQVQLVSHGSSYKISSSQTKHGSLQIDTGNFNFTFNTSLAGGQTKTIFSTTRHVYHHQDGTKICPIKAVAGINVTLSGTYWGNVVTEGGATLNNIPRTSSFTISDTDVTLGESTNISISRASSSFTHKIYENITGSWRLLGDNIATSYTFATNAGWSQYIPSATSKTITILVKTYSGSSYVGETSKTMTVRVPTNQTPSFSSLSLSKIDGSVPSSWNVYVQGKSKVTATINGATGSNGSSIISYNITGNQLSASAQSATSNFLSASGTLEYTGKITDSRGRSITKTASITVQPYYTPRINSFSATRCSSDGTEDGKGTHIKAVFSLDIAPIANKNGADWRLRYRVSGASAWTDLKTGTSYSHSETFISDAILSLDSAYEIQLYVGDYFVGSQSSNNLSSGFTLMNWHENGQAMGIGMVSDGEGLDIGMPLTIHGGINYISIKSGEDLNNYKTAGFYKCIANATAGTIASVPVAQAFTLEVKQSVGVIQEFTVYATANPVKYIRTFYSSWGAWRKIPYLNTGTTYPAFDSPNWMQTPTSGILPFKSGVTSSIGTSSWRFASAYIENIYANGGHKIIDSGGDFANRWVRFADGTQICCQMITKSLAITTGWGNGVFLSAKQTGITYQKSFVQYPNVQMSASNSADIAWIVPSGADSNLKSYDYYLARGKTLTTAKTFYIYVTAIGRWK